MLTNVAGVVVAMLVLVAMAMHNEARRRVNHSLFFGMDPWERKLREFWVTKNTVLPEGHRYVTIRDIFAALSGGGIVILIFL